MSLLWNFFDLGLYFHIDNCWDRWYNCKRWLCASAGTGRQARLRCVCLRRTGSSPVSRTNWEDRRLSSAVFFYLNFAELQDITDNKALNYTLNWRLKHLKPDVSGKKSESYKREAVFLLYRLPSLARGMLCWHILYCPFFSKTPIF